MIGLNIESLEDGIADDTDPVPTGPAATFFFSGPSSSTPLASLFLRESRFVLFPLTAPPPRAAFPPLLTMLAGDGSVFG